MNSPHASDEFTEGKTAEMTDDLSDLELGNVAGGLSIRYDYSGIDTPAHISIYRDLFSSEGSQSSSSGGGKGLSQH